MNPKSQRLEDNPFMDSYGPTPDTTVTKYEKYTGLTTEKLREHMINKGLISTY